MFWLNIPGSFSFLATTLVGVDIAATNSEFKWR